MSPTITYVYPIKVGTVLTGNKGAWQKADRFTFQWLRCNDNGESCKKIGSATGTTYTVVNADQGHTIRLDVTASNADGSTTVRANATSEVPTKPGAPVEVSPPTISGQAVVGETLTATTGKWKGNQPISYTFKWQSCTPNLSSCPANGASGNTYTVKGADTGKRLRVKVIAKNSAGQTAGLSDPTAKVTESRRRRRRRQLRAGELARRGRPADRRRRALLAEPGDVEEHADPGERSRSRTTRASSSGAHWSRWSRRRS